MYKPTITSTPVSLNDALVYEGDKIVKRCPNIGPLEIKERDGQSLIMLSRHKVLLALFALEDIEPSNINFNEFEIHLNQFKEQIKWRNAWKTPHLKKK